MAEDPYAISRVLIHPCCVPISYNKATSNGQTYQIKQGQLNKLRLRPQILNEHAESSRNIIANVSSGNIVGQIFKASQDNINGIDLTLESSAITSLDDFESYADSAALQAAWVYTDTGSEAILNTVLTSPATSTKSMQLNCAANEGEEWIKTITSADFTGITGSLRFRANKEYADLKLRVFIGDGTNTKSAPVIQSGADIWEKIEISEAQLSEDGVGTTNSAAITKVGFRVEDQKPGAIVYIDTIFTAPSPGSIALKIYDMGTSIPVSGTTTLADGTQYEKIGDLGISGLQESLLVLNLEGGFRNYHIDRFVCGAAGEIPTNELLTSGNYYALTLTYVDTNVDIYGSDPTLGGHYANGFAFTTPNEATAITATGENEDIMFAIYSTQDVYVSGFQNFADAAPNGNSLASLYVEDSEMTRTNVLITGVKPPQVVDRTLSIPVLLEKGGKIEEEYNDDFTDSVSKVTFLMIYYYEPQAVNG